MYLKPRDETYTLGPLKPPLSHVRPLKLSRGKLPWTTRVFSSDSLPDVEGYGPPSQGSAPSQCAPLVRLGQGPRLSQTIVYCTDSTKLNRRPDSSKTLQSTIILPTNRDLPFGLHPHLPVHCSRRHLLLKPSFLQPPPLPFSPFLPSFHLLPPLSGHRNLHLPLSLTLPRPPPQPKRRGSQYATPPDSNRSLYKTNRLHYNFFSKVMRNPPYRGGVRIKQNLGQRRDRGLLQTQTLEAVYWTPRKISRKEAPRSPTGSESPLVLTQSRVSTVPLVLLRLLVHSRGYHGTGVRRHLRSTPNPDIHSRGTATSQGTRPLDPTPSVLRPRQQEQTNRSTNH